MTISRHLQNKVHAFLWVAPIPDALVCCPVSPQVESRSVLVTLGKCATNILTPVTPSLVVTWCSDQVCLEAPVTACIHTVDGIDCRTDRSFCS